MGRILNLNDAIDIFSKMHAICNKISKYQKRLLRYTFAVIGTNNSLKRIINGRIKNRHYSQVV